MSPKTALAACIMMYTALHDKTSLEGAKILEVIGKDLPMG